MLISGFLILSSCKKDIDIFTPAAVLENVELGSEYMVLMVEGKQLLASHFDIKTGVNGLLQLNAEFQSDTAQNESIIINFNIPSNGVGSYSLMGIPFELNYKGKTILGWELSVTITEYGSNSMDKIKGTMTGTINVAGTGVIPLILNFSAKRT
ncbi:MAG: hypothetical protein IPI60_08345 [Saprospiraceae bacterium]|nr:hypothetical protein [Saprospiraceae bacterium]